MAILVTGGAGYIGSHVVRQLFEEQREEIIVVDDLSTGFKESLIHNEKLLIGDARDQAFLENVFNNNKIDTVMHFAASIVVPESVRDPLKYYGNNVGTMTSLLLQCQKHKVNKFIFSSTAAVYGQPTKGIADEEDPRRPESPYGASKAMAERVLRDYGLSSGIKYAILRYFNVAGADPQYRMGQRSKNATHLIKVCCEAALGKRKFVEIFGEDYRTSDGTCIRDYVHVEDLAAAHLVCLQLVNGKDSNLVVNVGYGKGYSVKDVISTAWRVSGNQFKVKIGKRRPGDPEVLVAKSDKIKTLGWKPRYATLEKIITDAYNFEKTLS